MTYCTRQALRPAATAEPEHHAQATEQGRCDSRLRYRRKDNIVSGSALVADREALAVNEEALTFREDTFRSTPGEEPSRATDRVRAGVVQHQVSAVFDRCKPETNAQAHGSIQGHSIHGKLAEGSRAAEIEREGRSAVEQAKLTYRQRRRSSSGCDYAIHKQSTGNVAAARERLLYPQRKSTGYGADVERRAVLHVDRT